VIRGNEPMERTEAISYLKAILSSGSHISPNAITLEGAKEKLGYEVHIREFNYRETVRDIAKRRHLLVKEQKDEIIVYK
jgi:hypothetical protein